MGRRAAQPMPLLRYNAAHTPEVRERCPARRTRLSMRRCARCAGRCACLPRPPALHQPLPPVIPSPLSGVRPQMSAGLAAHAALAGPRAPRRPLRALPGALCAAALGADPRRRAAPPAAVARARGRGARFCLGRGARALLAVGRDAHMARVRAGVGCAPCAPCGRGGLHDGPVGRARAVGGAGARVERRSWRTQQAPQRAQRAAASRRPLAAACAPSPSVCRPWPDLVRASSTRPSPAAQPFSGKPRSPNPKPRRRPCWAACLRP